MADYSQMGGRAGRSNETGEVLLLYNRNMYDTIFKENGAADTKILKKEFMQYRTIQASNDTE
jgi:ATP-dependent helicase YprA (DUF1998 family)